MKILFKFEVVFPPEDGRVGHLWLQQAVVDIFTIERFLRFESLRRTNMTLAKTSTATTDVFIILAFNFDYLLTPFKTTVQHNSQQFCLSGKPPSSSHQRTIMVSINCLNLFSELFRSILCIWFFLNFCQVDLGNKLVRLLMVTNVSTSKMYRQGLCRQQTWKYFP